MKNIHLGRLLDNDDASIEELNLIWPYVKFNDGEISLNESFDALLNKEKSNNAVSKNDFLFPLTILQLKKMAIFSILHAEYSVINEEAVKDLLFFSELYETGNYKIAHHPRSLILDLIERNKELSNFGLSLLLRTWYGMF